MIRFYWAWDFELRGIHLGVSYSWHTSITALVAGQSHILSIGLGVGLVVITW